MPHKLSIKNCFRREQPGRVEWSGGPTAQGINKEKGINLVHCVIIRNLVSSSQSLPRKSKCQDGEYESSILLSIVDWSRGSYSGMQTDFCQEHNNCNFYKLSYLLSISLNSLIWSLDFPKLSSLISRFLLGAH